MQRKISVRAIVMDGDKVFCVRLKAYGGSEEREYWCLPGGGIDEKEPLHDALKREMVEETGVEPEIGSLLYVQQFVFGDREQMEFFFHVTNTEDYKNIDLSSTSHGEEEIAELGFIDPKTTYVLPELLAKEPLRQHIEQNQPTKVFNYL